MSKWESAGNLSASTAIAGHDGVETQIVKVTTGGLLLNQPAGGVAAGATDSGNPIKIGALYKTTPATVTDGQRSDLYANATGALRVTLDAGAGAGAVVISNNTADNQASQAALFVASQNKAFGGTNWDRVRTAVGAAAVNTGIGSMSVEEGGRTFLNIVLAAPTTTTVKSGAGHFHKLIINKPTANGVITMYDNTAASGTLIGTITQPAALLSSGPNEIEYNVAFATGLTFVTATAAQDITVIYR